MPNIERQRPGRARRRSRQGGFSLIIIFMLMVIVVGVAATMLWGTRAELNVGGISREQSLALNAAEYAVAQAKALIAAQPNGDYNATTGWTTLLAQANPATPGPMTNYFCSTDGTNPTGNTATAPGVKTRDAVNGWNTLFLDAGSSAMAGAPTVQWHYCIHNNAEDPGYVDTAGNSPVNVANGEISDSRDSYHLLVIEGYGQAPNSTVAHVTVTIGTPTVGTVTTTPGDAYSQEGGNASHGGGGSYNEKGITVQSGSTTF